MNNKIKIAVIGAGITGTSTAYRFLLRNTTENVELTVIAKEFSPDTTSDGAAGHWEPYYVGETPIEMVR